MNGSRIQMELEPLLTAGTATHMSAPFRKTKDRRRCLFFFLVSRANESQAVILDG